MTITKEQSNEMLEAATPLINWMKQNCHPHCLAMVDSSQVELFEGVARVGLGQREFPLTRDDGDS